MNCSHVVGPGDQALYQSLAGMPILDGVVEHQLEGPPDRWVGRRVADGPQVALVGRGQPGQDHPVEAGERGRAPGRGDDVAPSGSAHPVAEPSRSTTPPCRVAKRATVGADGTVRAAGSVPARTGSRSAHSSACQA